MCESSVWVRHPDGRTEKIADNILIAQQDGPNVVLRGLLSEPLCVAGTIQEIDSLKHTITLITETIEANVRALPAYQHAPAEAISDARANHTHRRDRPKSPVVEWEFTRTNG